MEPDRPRNRQNFVLQCILKRVKSVSLQSAAIKLSPIFIGLAHPVLLLLLLPESRHSLWHFRAEQILKTKWSFLKTLNIIPGMVFLSTWGSLA